MVETKEVEVKTDSNDWSEEYKGDRPVTDSNWFSDVVPEGDISFNATIKFKNEGIKTINHWDKDVIRFTIEHDEIEKTMEVGCTQYDYLKTLATNKPLTGKTAEHQRTGSTQKDTRRNIKFK